MGSIAHSQINQLSFEDLTDVFEEENQMFKTGVEIKLHEGQRDGVANCGTGDIFIGFDTFWWVLDFW